MNTAFIRELKYQLRWALPVWFLWLFTGWWPNSRVTMRVRGWLHSPFFKRCGRNFRMANGITFVNPHGIEIGDDVYVAHYAWLNGIGGLVMEDEVVVGPFVTISTVNHCRKNGSFRYGGYRAAPVRIGRGSWLAAHVSVAAGVIVGTGCLIAANSVVTRSLPENAVAGGVPAKVLKPCEDSVPSLVSRSGFVASA